MSGRKRKSSSESDSPDAAAANKKAKKQHLEAQANITAPVASGLPGSNETTVNLHSSISTPTISVLVDTGNSTTTLSSINPIMTPNTISSTRSHQAQIASGSPGPNGTTVIMDSSISTPTTNVSVDTVNSTTTSPAVNPIMTPNTISSTRSHQAQIASGLPGPSGTTVIIYSRISTPTTSVSVDTWNSTTTTTSVNPIMTPNTISSTRSHQDTSLFTSEEFKHLSEFMNASVRSLPVARLYQNYIKRHNQITAILCGILKIPHMEFVGSTSEGTDDYKSDKDTIWFSDNHDGFDSLEFLPDEGHPGYSKIHVDNLPNNSDLKDYTDTKDGKNYLKNSVRKKFIIDEALSNFPFELSSHGAAYTAVMHGIYDESLFPNKKKEEVDHVFCIKCTKWPVQADEWKSRRRDSNWPTRELVKIIIQSGCLLTAVGSKELKENEFQWRVSFNKAEQLIIKSFNETQIHCILLLKLLKTKIAEVAGKNITSYIMKNIMFWCLEESSNDYWKPSNLVSCFRLCVSKLQSSVEKKFLPNYFIKKRNLIIASEFTDDIQTKTKQYLKNVLEDSTTCIRLLLPYYRKFTNNEISLLYSRSQKYFIETWIKTQILMAHGDQDNFGPALAKLYDGDNIQYIFRRCNEALDKLTTVGYTQPLVKILQNYMGVLQYILLIEKKETGEHRTNSDTRETYSKYITLSASGDLAHNTLRIATCYLDDDVKDDCLNMIRAVTCTDNKLFMRPFKKRLNKILRRTVKALRKKLYGPIEIDLHNCIIHNIDFTEQNPYQTAEAFQFFFKEKGHTLIGYHALNLAWKRCYFDVTFMHAELPVLPKPAALELCTDNSQKHVSFHPLLFGLLLEYLWHEKYGSSYSEKKLVLEKMENCVSIDSMIPDKQKSVGLNFMAYCYSLQKDNQFASKCLVRSLRLNPIRKNIAYQYMKYRTERLRQS